MSAEYKNLPYRTGVGIMLLNPQKQIFVARRIDTKSEAWQMPQGGVDEGEDVFVAALREMAEEIGTNKATLLAQSKDWYYYDLPNHLVPTIWGGKFRGQKQKWFCFAFAGTDADINIETEHPEFCEWKWVAPNEVPKLIVPFKQELYKNLINEFAQYFRE